LHGFWALDEEPITTAGFCGEEAAQLLPDKKQKDTSLTYSQSFQIIPKTASPPGINQAFNTEPVGAISYSSSQSSL
jgi:hypothetical protein